MADPVTEHSAVRIQELLGRRRGAMTGGIPGLTSWSIAAELGISVDTARRWLRSLVAAQRVEVRKNPLSRNGHLYRLAP